MKKFVFALLAFSSLLVLSCRQQEEMMDSEDLKSLSVLQEAKAKVNASRKDNSSNIKQDTVNLVKKLDASMDSFQEIDFEVAKPPK
jgi:hypothetical protein